MREELTYRVRLMKRTHRYISRVGARLDTNMVVYYIVWRWEIHIIEI